MTKTKLISAVNEDFDHIIKDPLWNDIKLDDGFKNLFLEPAVQKLDRIRQNGPACHVYPGAVHTRLSHSLGVYHTGRLIMQSLLNYDTSMLSPEGIRSFLAACLLHDIGHFPYAHSLKELSIREHEELACQLIDEDHSLKEAVRSAGADPEAVKAIIDKNKPCSEEIDLYRNILSGALDPDKLDYLNRDAFFAGVPYGLQDNSYIISSMRLYKNRIALTGDAVSSLEHLLFSKYLMYRNVYWHKGVRSATSMIKKALLQGLQDRIISYDDLYFIDDHEFDNLAFKHKDYKPFRLIRAVADNQLLSRLWKKDYEEDGSLERECSDLFSRLEVEASIYRELRKRYRELDPSQVIIDIQEPVSFESSTMILDDEKGPIPFDQATRIFTHHASALFTGALRSVSLFAPSYVSRELVKEIINGMQ